MMRAIVTAWLRLREWASAYEPAVAATVAAAVFQMLAGLGIAVGDLPAKVDAVLGFVAVLATVVAGRAIRSRVYSLDTHVREKDGAFRLGRLAGRVRR